MCPQSLIPPFIPLTHNIIFLIICSNPDPSQGIQKINCRFLHLFLLPLEPNLIFEAPAQYMHTNKCTYANDRTQTFPFLSCIPHTYKIVQR